MRRRRNELQAATVDGNLNVGLVRRVPVEKRCVCMCLVVVVVVVLVGGVKGDCVSMVR